MHRKSAVRTATHTGDRIMNCATAMIVGLVLVLTSGCLVEDDPVGDGLPDVADPAVDGQDGEPPASLEATAGFFLSPAVGTPRIRNLGTRRCMRLGFPVVPGSCYQAGFKLDYSFDLLSTLLGRFRILRTPYCLALVDPVTVGLAGCVTTNASQFWRLEGNRIISLLTGQCLADVGGPTLQTVPCTGAATEGWQFLK
jgi:hypothetical protein